MLLPCQVALAQVLSKLDATALAEKFVVENGYTSASPERVKRQPDFESVERTDNRSEMLQQRFNTLLSKAIGAKQGRKGSAVGWSIAFEYTLTVANMHDICRVVTMNDDGSNMHMEHVDGFRKFFAGFD